MPFPDSRSRIARVPGEKQYDLTKRRDAPLLDPSFKGQKGDSGSWHPIFCRFECVFFFGGSPFLCGFATSGKPMRIDSQVRTSMALEPQQSRARRRCKQRSLDCDVPFTASKNQGLKSPSTKGVPEVCPLAQMINRKSLENKQHIQYQHHQPVCVFPCSKSQVLSRKQLLWVLVPFNTNRGNKPYS